MRPAAAAERLFFALWPPPDLQQKLADWANHAAGSGRAMRRENLHLTLAFLGDTEAALVPRLVAIASALRFDPFRLVLDTAAYWKHNRIIWCGAQAQADALAALAARLRDGLSAAGIRYDPQPLVAHVTLVRDAARLPSLPAWIPLTWDVRDFALVRSNRGGGRVTYEVMQRFAAAAG